MPAQPDAVQHAAVAGAALLDDPTLAAVEHLTGDGAAPMLAAAVDAMGATLDGVRVVQVSHEPGRHCTVTYQVRVGTSGASTVETMVATTSVDGPPPGAAVLEADGLRVGLWRYPFDPALPALQDAVVPARVEHLLAGLLGGPLEPRVLTYRPGRRAVVHVAAAEGDVYLKVLRPSRAARLAERHERLVAAAVPVPPLVHADLDRGLLVLGALDRDGAVPLRSLLTGRPDRALPRPTDLAPVLDALAAAGRADEPLARRSPLRDVTVHADALAAAQPERAAEVALLLERLRSHDAGDGARTGSGVLVHGDLHDGQIMVDRSGRIVGLLDLDDVGTGARADDLGNLLGHATTMAVVGGPVHGAAARDWAAGVLDLAVSVGVGRGEVARRAAAATISLATGPFRTREDRWEQHTSDRLAAAAALLDRADRDRADRDGAGRGVATDAVREVSPANHGGLIPARENRDTNSDATPRRHDHEEQIP